MAPLPLIGVDACVLIEAAKHRGDHPSAFLIRVAASRAVFRLLIVEQAYEEACGAIGPDSIDRLLASCEVLRWPTPTETELAPVARELVGLLRHYKDVPLALAVRQAQPAFFVSSNNEHWRPAIGPSLNTRICQPRRFLELIGVPAPPRR